MICLLKIMNQFTIIMHIQKYVDKEINYERHEQERTVGNGKRNY